MPDLEYLMHVRPDRLDLRPQEESMLAVVTAANGGYEQLQFREVAMPRVERGEVLLRVLAAGVNNTEINTRLGWYSSSVTGGTDEFSKVDTTANNVTDGGWNESTPFPLIQGTDCCGRVLACGDGVDRAWIGTRVLVRACMRRHGFGCLDNIWMASDFDGAFAQFVKVPASEVFAIDCGWSDTELATIPCAYGTAENMVHRAQIQAGDRVFVSGASGGVGSAVVQLVKRRAATIVAQASRSKFDALRSLGVDDLIDRNDDPVDSLGERSVDAVFDNVAGNNFAKMIKLLKPGGRYASSGAIAGPMVSMDTRDFYLKDLRLIGCTAWDEPVFANLIRYIEREEIRPLVSKTFPLNEIVEAQRQFLGKQHVGNFVLIPPP